MTELNLPKFDIKVRRPEGQNRPEVYDPLRDKYVALTPEEWVRQHFVNFLVSVKGIPASRMANEVSLRLNNTLRRCDTVIFDREARRPLAIVEYKAPHVTVSQHTFDQIVRYNMVLQARWLIVSNGLRHYCCEIDSTAGTYRFLKDIPDAATMGIEF